MRGIHWIACSLMIALMLAAGCQYARSQQSDKSAKKAQANEPAMPSAQMMVPSLQNIPMTAYWGA